MLWAAATKVNAGGVNFLSSCIGSAAPTITANANQKRKSPAG
jgi:hypothetical protein